MIAKEKLILSVLILGVFLSTFTFNIALASEETLLSESHITQTLDDEGVYSDLTEQFRDNLADNASVASAVENESVTPVELSTIAITESYTRSQVNKHIGEIVSFLNGTTGQIDFRLDYTVVKANIAEEVGQGTSTEINSSLNDEFRFEKNINQKYIKQVKSVTSRFQLLIYTATLVFFFSTGCLYVLARSVPETGSRAGTAFAISGAAMIILAYGFRHLVNLLFINPGQERGVNPDVLIDGATAVLKSLLITMVRYSVGALLLGISVVVVCRLIHLQQKGRLHEVSVLFGETEETDRGTTHVINPPALVGGVFQRAERSVKTERGPPDDIGSTTSGTGTGDDDRSSGPDRIEPQLAEIETTLESAETAVIRGDYISATEQCNTIESKLDNLDEKAGQSDSESLSDRLKGARAQLDTLQSKIAVATTLASELDEIAQRLTEIEAHIHDGSFQTALEQLGPVRDELHEVEQQGAKQELEHVAQRVQTLQDRYDATHEQATEGIRTEKVDSLRERLESVDEELSQVRLDIGTEQPELLQDRLETAKNELAEISRQSQRLETDTLNADITDLKERVDRYGILIETVSKVTDDIRRGDECRETARTRHDAGEYERALEATRRAQEAYEAALARERGDIPIDAEAIEAKLVAIESQRTEIQRDRRRQTAKALRGSLDEVETELNDAATALDSGHPDDASSQLDDVRATLQEAASVTEDHDLPDLGERVDRLTSRHDELRGQVQTLQDARQRVTDSLDTAESALDDATAALDSDAPQRVLGHLNGLTERFDAASTPIEEHDLTALADRLTALEQRHERLRQQAREARTGIPATVPDAPRHSLSYDDIERKKRLGRGGNADVFRATARTEGGDIDIALKEPRMSGDGTLHTETVERMMDEAETWQRLDDHDHIVGVVDYGSEPLPWIAMEHMDAGHLGERAGDLPLDQALWTAIATAEGVRHAHRRGVAHLDLKPENVLFRAVADAWDAPKVADWGLSKHLLNHSKSIEGISPHYAAPEQFADGYGTPDDITDVYQLGAVFYELFTGRPPFEGRPMRVMRQVETEQPTPPSELADVPAGLDDVLLTALATERDERYDAVVLLRNDLQELFES